MIQIDDRSVGSSLPYLHHQRRSGVGGVTVASCNYCFLLFLCYNWRSLFYTTESLFSESDVVPITASSKTTTTQWIYSIRETTRGTEAGTRNQMKIWILSKKIEKISFGHWIHTQRDCKINIFRKMSSGGEKKQQFPSFNGGSKSRLTVSSRVRRKS